MDYYNYTAKFNTLIEQQDIIIDNQEILHNYLLTLYSLIGLIAFIIILKMIISIVRDCL